MAWWYSGLGNQEILHLTPSWGTAAYNSLQVIHTLCPSPGSKNWYRQKLGFQKTHHAMTGILLRDTEMAEEGLYVFTGVVMLFMKTRVV